MKFKLHNIPAIIGGLLIIAGFFMPYIEIMFVKVTGLKLMEMLAKGESRGRMMGMNKEYIAIALVIWGMFPLSGILALLGGILNKKYLTLSGFIILTLVISMMLAALAFKGEKPMFISYGDMIGSGLYVTLLGLVFLLGFVVAYRKEEGTIHKPMLYISGTLVSIFIASLVWFSLTVG